MSEFLAEARVIIRPVTTGFRAELIAELKAATRGVVVPVPVTAVVAPTGLATAAAQSQAVTAALTSQAAATQVLGAQSVKTAQQSRSLITSQEQIRRGGLATALSLGGVRGATLAASSSFLAGAAAVTLFAKSVQLAAGLETDLNVFRVTARATAEEMARVREEAKLLGRDLTLPGITASDAAEAFLTLSRAGLSVQDSLAGARGTLQLAVAAQISFTDAAQLTASALNAFGLSGDSAVAVADTLTNAANASQASIAEMGIALRQSAAIADLAGFSFGETATFLTQLARAGLVGSDAGTSFRVSIQRLIAPTDDARAALERLRINLRDVQGNLRPEAFFELGDALERMGRAQGDATRQLIFGNDASRAAAFFARLNAEAFRDQERALNRQGAAAEQAGARTEGLGGKIENAKNQVTALGLELGELALPAVGVAVDGVALFFGALATNISESRKAFGGFNEDAVMLQEALTQISDDSGFSDFIQGAGRDALAISESLHTASDATDEFLSGLLGIEGASPPVAAAVKKLSNEEKRLAEQITDVHDRIDLQVSDFQRTQTAAQAAAAAIGRLTGQIAGLDEGVTRARIAGDEGAELGLLEQERERLQRLLKIQENIVAEGGRGAATARRKIREEILPQLESVGNEIESLIAGQVAESKRIADTAERARDERDRNILRAIGVAEDRRINATVRAETTATLEDDIATQIVLRDFYKRSIAEVRKTVKDAQLAAQTIASLTRDFISAQQEIASLKQQQRDAIREQRREERERQRESLSLDVQIAEATGNRSAEERARQAEIEFLQRQIRQTRAGSNQRKRLILELRQAQRELRELRGEREKASNAFNELTFSFLQQQQGFAANLLGNLIPGGSTGGLVGNISTAQGLAAPQFTPGIQQEAAVAAGRDLGFSRGQGNETNQLLRAILRGILNLEGRAGHPEARYQRAVGSGGMDYGI